MGSLDHTPIFWLGESFTIVISPLAVAFKVMAGLKEPIHLNILFGIL